MNIWVVRDSLLQPHHEESSSVGIFWQVLTQMFLRQEQGGQSANSLLSFGTTGISSFSGFHTTTTTRENQSQQQQQLPNKKRQNKQLLASQKRLKLIQTLWEQHKQTWTKSKSIKQWSQTKTRTIKTSPTTTTQRHETNQRAKWKRSSKPLSCCSRQHGLFLGGEKTISH